MFNVNITPFQTHIQQKQDWVSVARKAYQVKTALVELKKQEKQLIDELKALSGNKDSKGGGFIFTRIEKKGNIQYKDIPVLQGIDLEPFRGESYDSWKLEKK